MMKIFLKKKAEIYQIAHQDKEIQKIEKTICQVKIKNSNQKNNMEFKMNKSIN